LTGLHQHVGNWPGKTVTRAEGFWNFKDDRFQVIDLPGTYSLLSTSTDEEIARDYILFGAPDCTVIVADAVCLERNLNIAFQIMEITDRVVLCVNLIDEARRKGIRIDREVLEAQLGVPVVLTAARSGVGLAALKERVFEVATRRVQPKPVRVPYEPQLQAAIDEILPRIERAFPDLPNARWIAMRLIDGGDQRLRQEIESGVLADLSGRIGEESLELSVRPDKTEIGR
jgi:ferrous iron transport protein B